MKRTLPAFIFGVAAITLASAAAAQDGAGAASIARGRDLIQRNCAMCHAVGATDASPNKAAPPFRDLHLRYPVENLAEALGEGILTGHPQMPEFKFAPTEVEDIIHYLDSIQSRRPASAAPTTKDRRGWSTMAFVGIDKRLNRARKPRRRAC